MLDKKNKSTFHRWTTRPAASLKIRSWSASTPAPMSRSHQMKKRKSKTMSHSLNLTIRENSTSGIHLICPLIRPEEELWWNCTIWASNSSLSICWLSIELVTMSKRQLRYCSTNRCSRSCSELDTERFPEVGIFGLGWNKENKISDYQDVVVITAIYARSSTKIKLKSYSQGVVVTRLQTPFI